MDSHLGYSKHSSKGKNSGNSHNAHNEKTVRSWFEEIDLKAPRDRTNSFSPKLVRSTKSMEPKVISTYAHGMSTPDIS